MNMITSLTWNLEIFSIRPDLKKKHYYLQKMDEKIDEVIKFWFEETTPQQYWVKDETFDNKIRDRFSRLHRSASEGKLEKWRDTPLGALAEIIILDQFSRNLYRGHPDSFASDELGLRLAKEAIDKGFDKRLDIRKREFLYLPFMHSENKQDHEKAVELFSEAGLEKNLDFEHKHKVIIDRFGRYPHRNEILGRKSTPEEIEFLSQPGSSF